MVARTDNALDRRIDRLGTVFGKDNLLGLTVKQLSDPFPAFKHLLCRLQGKIVPASSLTALTTQVGFGKVVAALSK